MDNRNIVSLVCNGHEYTGWLSVRIESSLNSLCRVAQVSATRQAGDADLTASINVGDAASILIGNDVVLTGWITAKNSDYSATSVTLRNAGSLLTSRTNGAKPSSSTSL